MVASAANLTSYSSHHSIRFNPDVQISFILGNYSEVVALLRDLYDELNSGGFFHRSSKHRNKVLKSISPLVDSTDATLLIQLSRVILAVSKPFIIV